MIVRFPDCRRVAIFLLEHDGGWLVLTPRGHGWQHGDRQSAVSDAEWLAENWRLPIRKVA